MLTTLPMMTRSEQRNLSVLLVQPTNEYFVGFNRSVCVEPLGLEFIAGAVEDIADVAVVDMRIDPDLGAWIDRVQPHFVGVTCAYTADIIPAINAIRIARRKNPQAVIAVGGHTASLAPEYFFDVAELDYLVIGEGERPFRDLITAYSAGRMQDVEHIAGIYRRVGGTLTYTHDAAKTQEMDARPKPRRDLADPFRHGYHFLYYRDPWTVEMARGCEYRCNFCSVWKFHKKEFKVESAGRTVEEILRLNGRYIPFVDDLAFRKPQVAMEIANGLIDAKAGKRYWAQCRSNDVVKHPEVFEKLAEAGLDMVLMGLESIDQATLNKLRKGNKVENNFKAIEILHSFGVKIWGALIVDPEWGNDEFETLKEFVVHYGIECPQYTILTPLPGTDLYKSVESQLATKDPRWYDFLHTVLPTKLPIEKFYEKYASLYRVAGMTMQDIKEMVRSGWTNMDEIRTFRDRFLELTDVSVYLQSLQPSPQPLP